MEQTILVYVDLLGVPLKVGQLWAHFRNGRESISFEYDRYWLSHPKRFSLDPALKLTAELALDVAHYFGIDFKEAKIILAEVTSATALWYQEAARLKIKKAEIDRMSSAFEHDDFQKAIKNLV